MGAAGSRTWLVVPDVHRPYHDKVAWDAMVRAGRSLRPYGLVVLGDFWDAYSVSSHDRDPKRSLRLSDELEDARAGLAELADLGARRKVYCHGNHERRLETYIVQRAPELAGVVDVSSALGLRGGGWTEVPYRSHHRIGKLYVTHDVGYAGVHAAHQTGQAMQHNVAFGHTHRLSITYFGDVSGERHFAASCGWLGDEARADYMPQARRTGWQHGFAVAHMFAGGTVHMELCPIVSGRALMCGRRI